MEISLSFLIPLILVVIVNLAESARKVDVEEIFLDSNDDVFLFHLFWLDRPIRFLGDYTYVLNKVIGDNDQPTFGRLNLIHWLNCMLLGAGILLIVFSATGYIMVTLSFILVMFWMALPLLEVIEYDLMMRVFDNRMELRSLSVHVLTVGIVGFAPVVWKLFIGLPGPVTLVGASLVYVIILIGQINLFLELLEREFQLLERKGAFEG